MPAWHARMSGQRASRGATAIERSTTRPPDAGEPLRTPTYPPLPARMRTSRPPSSGRESVSIPALAPIPDFFHVRGHVLRATDQYILAAHGAAVRDRILAQLPSRFSDDFRHGSLAGVVPFHPSHY